jgi:replicative DNA helicase
LPGDERQVAAIIGAMGGSVEDAIKAELLYPRARRDVNPPSNRLSGSRQAQKAESVALTSDGAVKFEDIFQQVIDEVDGIASRYPDISSAIPTGFTDLDSVIGGLRPGQLTLIAGEQAVGKSTLALDFARSSVKHGNPCLYNSLQSDKSQVVMDLLAAEARLRRVNMRSGTMSDDDWSRLLRRTSEIVQLPLFMEDDTPHDAGEFFGELRQFISDSQIKLVVVDYLELLAAALGGLAADYTERLVLDLKMVARRLNVSVVAITAQWSSDPSSPSSYSPAPALKDIGAQSLTRHADVVLIVHRPDLHDRDNPRAGEADLVIAKNRNGPSAIVTVAHQLHYGRFADLAVLPPASR